MSNENPENQKSNNNLNVQDFLNYKEPSFNTLPKKSPWGDIFLGLGLSVLLIITMVATLYIGKAGIVSIISLILISSSTFLSVRFIRRTHPIAGKILLAIVIPITLIFLLFGACFVSLNGL
ncbi:hypothetical protein K9O30_14285 [Clostridium bowmanii]|uniref:hypothetical protein n=1 Tax=Clostridium bowmanii TaxID=132925 RepID=UPI001C0E34F0|nr:hypothetical protein [Clostridium bowmanii]MBU3190356.1 hypothetical protein [Clostridium bowmanii]MCA1074868.1 hypothetical protein [Clostridium bowmanii]